MTTCIPGVVLFAHALVQQNVLYAIKDENQPYYNQSLGRRWSHTTMALLGRSDVFCCCSFGLCKLETGAGESCQWCQDAFLVCLLALCTPPFLKFLNVYNDVSEGNHLCTCNVECYIHFGNYRDIIRECNAHFSLQGCTQQLRFVFIICHTRHSTRPCWYTSGYQTLPFFYGRGVACMTIYNYCV